MNHETIREIASFICGTSEENVPIFRKSMELVSFFYQFGIRYTCNPMEDYPKYYNQKVEHVTDVLISNETKINDIVIYLAESRIYMDCTDYAEALKHLNHILASEGTKIQMVKSKPQLATA